MTSRYGPSAPLRVGATQPLTGSLDILREQNLALSSLSDSLKALTDLLREYPSALLRSRAWEYVQRYDRANRSLAANTYLELYRTTRRGYLEHLYVRSSTPSLRLTLTFQYPNGQSLTVAATPRELQDDGLTRPTQTYWPYNALFDDANVQYAIAVDVPYPGHPFYEGFTVTLRNEATAAITIATYQVRTLELLQ
mgnify:CR=1 FL=1